MRFQRPIIEIIQERFSCRTYHQKTIDADSLNQLRAFIAQVARGPLGNQTRFELVSAREGDAKALRGLGTYGFIKDASAFIVGAMGDGHNNLEDFGYSMEAIILKATDLGLGTCWLGGTFTKSRFAKKINLNGFETIPAVTSVGYVAERPRWLDGKIREAAGSDRRLPWEKLFFVGGFETPLTRESAGEFALPLEMVRLGPSASNRQPWRVIKDGSHWHFYLRRSRGYRTSKYAKMLQMADLQRIDMGIAMCHFELAAREHGMKGVWQKDDPGMAIQGETTEYSVTWVGNEIQEGQRG